MCRCLLLAPRPGFDGKPPPPHPQDHRRTTPPPPSPMPFLFLDPKMHEKSRKISKKTGAKFCYMSKKQRDIRFPVFTCRILTYKGKLRMPSDNRRLPAACAGDGGFHPDGRPLPQAGLRARPRLLQHRGHPAPGPLSQPLTSHILFSRIGKSVNFITASNYHPHPRSIAPRLPPKKGQKSRLWKAIIKNFLGQNGRGPLERRKRERSHLPRKKVKIF